jgi:hypothetical protein
MGDRKLGQIIILFAALVLAGLSSGNELAFGEIKCDRDYEFRTINGTCNNLENPLYGSAGTELLRITPSAYSDGIQLPSGQDRPNPRIISNELAHQGDVSIPNNLGYSDYIWQWGQFLDHDIDLTPNSGNEPLYIEIDFQDMYFNPWGTGGVIHFDRSLHTEANATNPREQINVITSFIDASNVYGSDDILAESLRDDKNPSKLKTSQGNLLPIEQGSFVAGDERANEQIGLTAMHTLFVREHNRLAEEISKKHPDLDDEQVYQIARKIVGAKMQVITYNEFLPKLLGPNPIPEYSGYDNSTNPGIRNEFSTASYRYGHSQLSPNLMILDNSYMEYSPLRESFFAPETFQEKGLEAILRGLASQKAQEIDNKLVDDVRNFLFGPPGSGGFDLASLNIQRGRDHGLADYNTVRESYDLNKRTSFAQITSNTTLANQLSSTYDGNIENVDLWVGGLAEDPVGNGLVGETIRTILISQFTALRDGDRFWYENDTFFEVHPHFMKEVTDTTLAKVIKENTKLNDSKVQDDVFECRFMKGGGNDKNHADFPLCE